MNKQQILDAVASLAGSQGFYGRLYEQLKGNDRALSYLEERHFSDVVDMVLFLEC